MSDLVFIVGCGRSGTNWLSRILETSPDIINLGEIEPYFSKYTNRIVNNKLFVDDIFKELEKLKVKDKIVCVKIHPLLWYSNELLTQYRVIGIYRNYKDTISSMINHGGGKKVDRRL